MDTMQVQALFDARQREHEQELAEAYVEMWEMQRIRREAQMIAMYALLYGNVEVLA